MIIIFFFTYFTWQSIQKMLNNYHTLFFTHLHTKRIIQLYFPKEPPLKTLQYRTWDKILKNKNNTALKQGRERKKKKNEESMS